MCQKKKFLCWGRRFQGWTVKIESLEEELKAARSLAQELQDTQTKEFAAEVTSLEATVLGLQDELQLAKNKAAWGCSGF